MKRNWIIVLLLLVTSIGVFAEEDLWDSEELNFKFQPPSNWEVTVTKEDDTSYIEANSNTDESFLSIAVTKSVDGDFRDYKTSELDETREEMRLKYDTDYGGVSANDIDINGLKFFNYEILFDVDHDFHILLGHYNDMVYLVEAYNDPEGPNYDQNLVEQSIQSLVVYKSEVNKRKDFFYGVLAVIGVIIYLFIKGWIRSKVRG